MMPFRRLGNSGLLVSRLSFGAWITFGTQLDVDDVYGLMRLCLSSGMNFFDNAETYNDGVAEEIMGKALVRLKEVDGLRRGQFVISTKIFWGTSRKGKRPGRWQVNERGLSRKHIIEGLTDSLQRLQLEYVDIVFAHRPDEGTPMEETVRAMNHVIERGMALYWGTSEWSAYQIRDAIAVADRLNMIRPITEQPQYSMLHRRRLEVEYEPLFESYNYGTTIWSALSSGVLTGKYLNGIPEGSRLSLKQAKYILDGFHAKTRHAGIGWDDILERVRGLASIAESLDCSLPQLAIAWTLMNDRVTTVILGATKQSQLVENLGALQCMKKLTAPAMQRIEGVLQNSPSPNPTFNAIPAAHSVL
eukprot:g1134.t1